MGSLENISLVPNSLKPRYKDKNFLVSIKIKVFDPVIILLNPLVGLVSFIKTFFHILLFFKSLFECAVPLVVGVMHRMNIVHWLYISTWLIKLIVLTISIVWSILLFDFILCPSPVNMEWIGPTLT